MIKTQRGNNPRRRDKRGVVVASRDDCADAPVPAQVVQGPVVGDTPDAEGVPAGVQVQPEASSVRRFSRATQGMTWAQVVQVQPEAGQVRRPTRATKGLTSRYKDLVKE